MNSNHNSFGRYRNFIVVFIFCIPCFINKIFAQPVDIVGGKIFHFNSANTCFPETKRINGYTNGGVFFDAATHYRDSSVLMLVPDKLKLQHNTVDIVFWFHGWRNNIDTALNYFHLAQQFVNSKKNAVLVLAEGPKNAADSYGGKLEQTNVFKRLLQDVLKNLQQNKKISAKSMAGNIILAGHSGAYRVIAYMLQNGGVPIKQVVLFDALYSETDKYMQWIKNDSTDKFINIYTNKGGTAEECIKMMAELKAQNIPYLFTEEKDMTPTLLNSGRIIFIHSEHEHNDIIFNPDNFQAFLESSPFLKNIH